jgi:hypothetical protein
MDLFLVVYAQAIVETGILSEKKLVANVDVAFHMQLIAGLMRSGFSQYPNVLQNVFNEVHTVLAINAFKGIDLSMEFAKIVRRIVKDVMTFLAKCVTMDSI